MNNTHNKWLSVIVAFILCLPLYAWNGSGTYEDPYEINTASDVADLATAVNGGADQSGVYFLQIADIDLSTFGNFTPIGSASAPFAGNYDGDGYILSNLTITASVSGATTNAFGYFGYAENATVENVSVYGKISVLADYNANACVGVGGVVGIGRFCIYASDVNYADVSLSLSDHTSDGENASIKYGVGGVVGIIRDDVSKNYYYLENHGNIVFLGMSGSCCCGGVASYQVVHSGAASNYGCAYWRNYGRVVASGRSTREYNDGFCSGVLSAHYKNYGGGQRPLKTYHCENFGDIVSTGAVHTAGIHIQTVQSGSEFGWSQYCTNYGNIRSFHNGTWATDHAGVMAVNGTYTQSYASFCANYGDILVDSDYASIVNIGGVFFGGQSNGSTYNSNPSNNKCSSNGRIVVRCPFAIVYVGGVQFAKAGIRVNGSRFFGCVDVVASNAFVSGVKQRGGDASASRQDIVSSSASLGNIKVLALNGNVSGVCGGTYSTHETTITNCYSLSQIETTLPIGSISSELKGNDVIARCYGVGDYPLFGSIDTLGGSVAITNVFSIGKVATDFGSAITNNVKAYAYDTFYRNPSVSGNYLYNYAFTNGGRDTNSFYDLALPINKLLFPTITDEIKQKHNWTRLNGYKRYIRTIQQQ